MSAVPTSSPTRRVSARRVERVLLAVALVAALGALAAGLIPVSNPGVQSCGSPFAFAWSARNDAFPPSIGAPGAPANAAALAAQAPCHERVAQRLIISGGLVLVAIATGLAGAVVGLADDRRRYRGARPFESYLRERPEGVPADPWDQPVVPESDLGQRLPDIEASEVRLLVGAGAVASVALIWLAGPSRVAHDLGHARAGLLLLALVLAALTYPIATGAWLSVGTPPGEAGSAFSQLLAASVASSFLGRLLPEYGAPGLIAHVLARSGRATPWVVRRVGAALAASFTVHAVLVVVALVTVADRNAPAGSSLRAEWLVWLALVAFVFVGALGVSRRYHNLVVAPDAGSFAELGRLRHEPGRLVGLVASCAALALVGAFVFVVVTAGFSRSADVAPLLFVGLLAPVIAVLAPTPDGAGAVEIALVLGGIWAGVAAPTAVLAMLATRILMLWLPLLPGWLLTRRMVRAGTL